MIDLSKFQEDTEKWVSQYKIEYFPPHVILALLGEEYGELSREINDIYGLKTKKDTEEPNTIGRELADILFTITCFANSRKILDLQKTYSNKDIDVIGQEYESIISNKNFPAEFMLYFNLGTKIEDLKTEAISPLKPNKDILRNKTLDVFMATIHIADYYEINLTNEWNDMVNQKLYKRDVNRQEKK
ncbi:MAG: MazG nucleotide pyrophosphohydrolase domain-containing protein [Candidatus Nanoarchaeia archaeon]